MSYKIHCADCGAPAETKRANALYCRLCRVQRDALYFKGQKRKCHRCPDMFIPSKANDCLCGNCDFINSSVYAEGQCALCRQSDRPLLGTDVRVCLRCAKSPEKRRTFEEALSKKFQLQVAQYGAKRGTAIEMLAGPREPEPDEPDGVPEV